MHTLDPLVVWRWNVKAWGGAGLAIVGAYFTESSPWLWAVVGLGFGLLWSAFVDVRRELDAMKRRINARLSAGAGEAERTGEG